MINSFAYTLQGNQGCHRRRGIYLHGENGTLVGDYGVLEVVREACFLNKFNLDDDPQIIERFARPSPRVARRHPQPQAAPSCNVGYHCKIDMALTLSLLSLKLGRSIKFDPQDRDHPERRRGHEALQADVPRSVEVPGPVP